MKKKLYAVVILLSCCWFSANAQVLDWTWGRNAVTSGFSEGLGIASDKQENVFIAGYYTGTITFAPYSFSATQASFLTKYDANGNVKWAKTSTGSIAAAYATATDVSGNSFITGYYQDSTAFGGNKLYSQGGYDYFLVKYDPSGNVVWAKTAGGAGTDYGESIVTDSTGNLYATGYFYSATFSIGSFNLAKGGTATFFLARYDSAGNVLWARSNTGSGSAYATSVAADGSGNVYVTGYFSGNPITFGSVTLSSAGSTDAFLVKYDSTGNVLWARSSGSTGTENCYGVACDGANNVYITGSFSSPTCMFGPLSLTLTAGGDGFLTKYDSSGNALWAKAIGGSMFERGYSLSADKNNNIYVSCSFTSPVATLDTLNILRPSGWVDPMFVACVDSAGHGLFAKALLSGGDDWSGVSVTPSGCVYVGGDIEQTAMVLGNDTLFSPTGQENIFVARLCYTALAANFNSSDTLLCIEGNTCVNFYDLSAGSPASWQWHFAGANPDTSSLQNPVNVCYSSAGTYTVSLTVSNSSGTDSFKVASMIIVGSAPLPPIVTVVGGDTLYSSHGLHYQWYLNGAIIPGATDSFYVTHQGGTYSVQVTDQYGCNSQSAGTLITGIELFNGVGVAVYPNPFHNELTVTPYPLKGVMAANSPLGDGGEFILFDVTSRELLHRSFANQTTINTEHLARGIYFYEVKNEDGLVSRGKVVKE